MNTQQDLVPFYKMEQHYKDTRTVFIVTSVLYAGLIIAAICLKEWQDIIYMFSVLALLIYGALANNKLKDMCELAVKHIHCVATEATMEMIELRKHFNMNVNDRVKVTLTKHGAEVFNKFYEDLHKDCPMVNEMHCEEGYVLETQLHELMLIFGKSLTVGSAIPFEKNHIEVTSIC